MSYASFFDDHQTLLKVDFLFAEQLIEIGQSTGVILDPVYTLKATRGMLQEMSENPSRFKGRRVLFLHTGNISSLPSAKASSLHQT